MLIIERLLWYAFGDMAIAASVAFVLYVHWARERRTSVRLALVALLVYALMYVYDRHTLYHVFYHVHVLQHRTLMLLVYALEYVLIWTLYTFYGLRAADTGAPLRRTAVACALCFLYTPLAQAYVRHALVVMALGAAVVAWRGLFYARWRYGGRGLWGWWSASAVPAYRQHRE